MFEYLANLDIGLQGALIGALTASFTAFLIFIFGVMVESYKERKKKKATEFGVYKYYADPLLSSSISLFWRLREVLVDDGRGTFLKNSGESCYFDQYKFDSTLYRLASLIGWVRAYRRELTFLVISQDIKLETLNDAISKLESALADGAHVEAQRLKSIAQLWGLTLPEERSQFGAISVAVEEMIKPFRGERSVAQSQLLALENPEKERLCQDVAAKMCNMLGVNPVSTEIVVETTSRAISALAIKEAWLYRDFQSGLGDILIEKTEREGRMFEVIGYKAFEEILLSKDEESKRWIARLKRIFESLDVSGADSFDARVELLNGVFDSTMDIILALVKIEPAKAKQQTDTLTSIKNLKKDCR